MTDVTTGVRVLFTGQYWPGANTLYIARAFEQCGAIVRLLNDTTIVPGWSGVSGKLARRVLLRAVIETEWNRQLLELVAEFKPDLVYVTNADLCWPETLAAVRKQGIPMMCFYHDVVWKGREGSRFAENIREFDLVATTRSWQEPEFREAGAKDVSIARFGYDALAHRRVKVEPLAVERYGADITFIASYELHRAAELTSLVKTDFSYHFRLWGPLWNLLPTGSPLRQYWQGRLVHEQEIPVVYGASKIALHWVGWEPHGTDTALQKGDQHNSRTFQIAACGGAMMLAQRTDHHRRFFTEDVEAVFFDDVDELRDKLVYWLDPARDESRKGIAAAARARCVVEDYSYVPIVRSYLEYFGLPVSTPNEKDNTEGVFSGGSVRDDLRICSLDGHLDEVNV